MTDTAAFISMAGISDPSFLFSTLVQIFQGTYSYDPATNVAVTPNGNINQVWFSTVPGIQNVTVMPSSGRQVMSAFLQSTSVVDSYLASTTPTNQTYNLYIQFTQSSPVGYPDVSGELVIYYGTSLNFTMPQLSDYSTANDLANGTATLALSTKVTPNPYCPQVNICGSTVFTNVYSSSSKNVYMPSIDSPSYLNIVLTNRGFALSHWKIFNVNNCFGNAMLCIQRPVDPKTGNPNVANDAPIFALSRSYDMDGSSTYNGWKQAPTPFGSISSTLTSGVTSPNVFSNDQDLDYGFWFSTIISNSIPSSTQLVSTTGNPTATDVRKLRPCFYRWAMDWNHPGLYDNYSNVVKFPYGFFTTYHLYLDEIDLICIVNAASFVSGQPISINMYGELLAGTSTLYARTYNATFGDVNYAQNNVIWNTSLSGTSASLYPIFHQISRTSSTGARLGILKDSSRDFH